MAYKKKTWISKEIITKEALNNIETAISDLDSRSHGHANLSILDTITSAKIQSWDNAASNSGGGSVDLSGYATKQELNSKADKSEIFSGNYNDLTNKPTIPSIAGLASETYVNNAIANAQLGGEEVDLSNYATKDELFSGDYNDLKNKPTIPSLSGYATQTYVKNLVSTYATQTYVDNAIAEAQLSGGDVEVNLDGYVTDDELAEVEAMFDGRSFRYITQAEYDTLSDTDKNNSSIVWCITDAEATSFDSSLLANYATKDELALKANKSELFSGNYNDLKNKPTIPSLNGYATEAYVDDIVNEIETAFLTLQDRVSTLESQIVTLLERIVALENQSGNEGTDPEEPTTIPCTGITLNRTSLTFTDTYAQTLTANVTPSNTTDTISWKSNRTSVATVSNGVVTPKSNGSCTITATCGNYSASCSITVNIEEEVTTYSVRNNLTNITTNNSQTSIEEGQSYSAVLTCGDDYEITSVVITMNGVDITDDVFVPEESTDDSGSGGDDSGGDGGDNSGDNGDDNSGGTQTPIDGDIVLDPTRIETSQIGSMFEINATLSSSLTGTTITWSSSKNEVVVVSNYSDTSGLAIINGIGTATITATCGSASATCEVIVSGDSSSGDDSTGDDESGDD